MCLKDKKSIKYQYGNIPKEHENGVSKTHFQCPCLTQKQLKNGFNGVGNIFKIYKNGFFHGI